MLEFILFNGQTGHFFFPFQAGSWEAADEVARLKDWKVDDHVIDADGRNVISVVAPALV